MRDRLRLEIYIARPPTQKCWQLISVMEEVVRLHPDEVRLLIFERGVPWHEQPCEALRTNVDKGGGGVPLSYVSGRFVAGARVPSLAEIEASVADMRGTDLSDP